jgi:flagellar hook-associated protein 1 FlgK
MSLVDLLNIGKSALFASQTALNVTGHNIANVNTDGYTRQDVVLEVSTPVATGAGYLGRGVTVSGIERCYSSYIQKQLLGQEQTLGKSTAQNEVMSLVEQVFNDASGVGLSESLESFFSAWSDVASDPDDSAARTVLLSDAESLVSTIQGMETDLEGTVSEINDEIGSIVGQINDIADKIAQLNEKIAAAESGDSGSANDLRDQRDALVTELASLTSVTTLEGDNGSLTVMVGMRTLVDGTFVNEMTTTVDSEGDTGLSLDGVDITSEIGEGRLGGLIESREEIQSGPLKQLRKLAAALTIEINEVHSAGYGLDGSTGNDFFSALALSTTDSSSGASVSSATITDTSALTLSEYDISYSGSAWTVTNRDTGAAVTATVTTSGSDTTIAFDGISVTVSGTVAAGDAFGVSPLTEAISNFSVALTDADQIAAASSSSSLPGDNTNALAIAELAETSFASLDNATFSGYYGEIVSSVGSMAADAADLQAFDENLYSELTDQRDSVSGVSLDEEATNLILYQRAYEAAARLISITDELLETVITLGA